MKKKLIKEYAEEMYELECILNNSDSSEEEVSYAKTRIMQISDIIFCYPDAMEIMVKIDEIIQEKFEK